MNENERAVLVKLSAMNLCQNEAKGVFWLLAGQAWQKLELPETSKLRTQTMLKQKGIIEKLDGRYCLTADFGGLFALAPAAAVPARPEAAPAAPPVPVPKPAPPAPKPVPPAPFAEFAPAARAFFFRPALQHGRAISAWFSADLDPQLGDLLLNATLAIAQGRRLLFSTKLDDAACHAERMAVRLFGAAKPGLG